MNIYILLKWNYSILGWVEVAWTNGTSNSYRMGADGKFDLRVVETGPSTDSSGEPSSSARSDKGQYEEGPSIEEAEVESLEKRQEESSSTSQSDEVSSMALVEAVRVEEIPDEGVFTSEDVIETLGNTLVVLETTDSTEIVPSADEPKETVGDVQEITEEEGVVTEPLNSVTETASSSKTASVNISVAETARR